MGNWEGAGASSQMRLRYADSKEDSAAIAKLTQVAFLRAAAEAGQVLTWEVCRSVAAQLDMSPVMKTVLKEFGQATREAETAPGLLSSVVARRVRFDVRALASRMALRKPKQHVTKADAKVAAVETGDSPGAVRNWVATAFQGEAVVHFLSAEDAVPLCRRRRGCRGRPVAHQVAAGCGIDSLRKMQWSIQVCCGTCMSHLPEEARSQLVEYLPASCTTTSETAVGGEGPSAPRGRGKSKRENLHSGSCVRGRSATRAG